MTIYERELLEIIRENDKPEQALCIAIRIISEHLMQRGSSVGQAAVGQ